MDTKLDIAVDGEEKWGFCCSAVHKGEIIYFIQVIFLFSLSVFAMVQIINKASSPEIYFSLLSTCIGIIVPSPTSITKKSYTYILYNATDWKIRAPTWRRNHW